MIIFVSKCSLTYILTQFSKRQISIIHAAGHIIQHEGIVGLTTKKIADKVGFTEGALYRHFKGKDEIISGLLSFVKQEMENLFLTMDPFLEPEVQFKAIFECQFIFFDNNPHFVDVVFSNSPISNKQTVINQLQTLVFMDEYLLPIVELAQKKNLFINQLSSVGLQKIAIGAFRLEMFNWSINNYQQNIIEKGQLLIAHLLLLFKTHTS